MKYPVGNLVGVVRVDQRIAKRCYDESTRVLEGRQGRYTKSEEQMRIHLLELDPRFDREDTRPQPDEDLKEVQIDLEPHQRKKIGESLDPRVEGELGAHPVSQKKRRLGKKKKRAVKAETVKLLQARFVREVKYPNWLSNVVMVKKSSGKWRTCTNYTDLNNVCPKDSYPLPNIDVLLDRAFGCGLLIFMDAYLGNNQIKMHPSDESKTTFIIDEGNFCYRVMPFGLKNSGTTY
ncbi:hypothetical protein CR513_37165, partial [Mucuna pruriens]